MVYVYSRIWLSLHKEVTYVICVNMDESCSDDNKGREQAHKDIAHDLTCMGDFRKLNLQKMVCLKGAEGREMG